MVEDIEDIIKLVVLIIKSPYLFIYNVIQFLGWLLFFVKVTLCLTKKLSISEIYDETHYILECCQYGAFLEIIHSLLGIVKSSIIATSIQILGRIGIVAILQIFRSAVSSGYLFIYFAWSMVEITRYYYYLFAIIKKFKKNFEIPYILKWCRYSFFILLYPTGVTGEIIILLHAKKDLGKYKLGNNYTFEHLVYPICILYIPCLIFLYYHLFLLRSKALRLKIEEKRE